MTHGRVGVIGGSDVARSRCDMWLATDCAS
jgi:hypothetical protein